MMIYIAFSPANLKIMVKQTLMFYLISFIFGGCAFALLYFINPKEVLMRNGVFVGKYPLQIALLSGVVGFIIIQITFKFIKNKINKKNMFCNIKIFMSDEYVKVKALIDTGNMLKDPISKIPVIVVEKDKLYKIFPKEILNNIEKFINYNIEENNIGGDKLNINEYLSRFRVIPFSSLGKQNGLLLGIKVDKIHVTNFEGEEVKSNAIVGIYNEELTKNGMYSALIGLDVMEGSVRNEFVTNFET